MAPSRPNILFVMADDHAAKAISCYGAGINYTPHLDRLAAEGMRFDHCYVTNSICTPSRAAILTGTHNHVNGVYTLDSKMDNRIPNVAKHLRSAGYQTAMIGKWHLGEGKDHEPTGFDHWSVLPGQGDYWDPRFIEADGVHQVPGYCTDIITDKSLAWLESTRRQPDRPFFLMCHHKAPHRKWECAPRHRTRYADAPIAMPASFDDDYRNRARAAAAAKMRVATDMDYADLGLAQPEGGRDEVGEPHPVAAAIRKIPHPDDVTQMRLVCKNTGEAFTFRTQEELRQWKYQRYMQRYLRCIQAVDDSVGALLSWLERAGLADDTVVVYTSDQGFFLGEHGWFDKRFIYEESFQMPLLVRYPREVRPGSVCADVVSNVDFAATWLDLAGRRRPPSYMQGRSFRPLLQGCTPGDWRQLAYHRYWMHRDAVHEAYAHYGVRDRRYKLIYWYNEGFGLPGTREGGQDREWELFDCETDPLELFNVHGDPSYAEVVARLTAQLEELMEEIGDEPVHERLLYGAE